MTIPEQIELLLRGTDRCISKEDLEKKLSLGRPLRIKFGVDPTSPDIHLGHTVSLLKLRQFQDLGHTAVLIIGNFTAQIGDPTGRNKARPPLSAEAIAVNAQTYEEQAFKVLDRSKTEIVHNADWFNKMTLMESVQLMSRRTVAQMIQRRDFKERMAAETDVMMHELQYPVLQGWDSVIVKSDVELGGSDQLFNLLVGRDLQEQEGQPPQVVITLPLLEGIDGVEKMSKSLNNYIGVTESPMEMFGKCMRISDELMGRWYRTLFTEEVDAGAHPMESKKRLAERIIQRFHDKISASGARAEFEKVFSSRQLPTDIPEKTVSENPIWIVKMLQEIGAAPSGSEARRLIKQGAVTVGEEKVTDEQAKIDVSASPVIKAGKRFFAKVSPPPSL